MSRRYRLFKNTELPSPNIFEPIALRVSERMPAPLSERRGARAILCATIQAAAVEGFAFTCRP